MSLWDIFAPAPPRPPDLPEEEHTQRWQCQSPLVRLWRLRWRLYAGVRFAMLRLTGNTDPELWDLLAGDADVRMNRLLSLEEVLAHLRERQQERTLSSRGSDDS